MTRLIDKQYNIEDLARLARRRLPRALYDFIDRGAEDEVTRRENRASIKRIFLRQRVGVDVSKRDISTTIFGVKQTMPIGIGVTGMSGLIRYDGERSLARAAAAAGVPYTVGSMNCTSQAELKRICGDLLWRQLYPPRRREQWEHHLAVTRAAGIRVLVVTMDSAVAGNREYIRRSGLTPGAMGWRTLQQVLSAPHWFCNTLLRYLVTGFPEFIDMPPGHTGFWDNLHSYKNIADDFTWDDVKTLRRRWSDVLVVKGLSSADDARIAASCGVDGIVVSNHGGRSLDGCVASMTVLAEIVDAVAPQVTVLIDGAFMRGADVLKAIALGASGVLLGRAPLFGLAAGGEAGVCRVLSILREEIHRAIALVGCRSLCELNRGHIAAGIGQRCATEVANDDSCKPRAHR
jgi:(S)-mandelate dehydrogenase